MKAVHLRCNYRKDPLGIDCNEVRFNWQCDKGDRQNAYQVKVWDEDRKTVFDSGKCEGSQMHVVYDGSALNYTTRYTWQVTVWDETDQSEESECAWFETGLGPDGWQAKWICGVDTDKEERLPADCFKRCFKASGEVKKARLYSTACGVYEAYVNGNKLSGVLMPGVTEYEKRLHYQIYDVTEFVKEDNEVCFTVADGWFKGKLGSTNVQYFFGKQLKLLAQFVIEYADGKKEVIGTDESWSWSNDGPVRYSDLKDGEIYDARMVPSYFLKAQVTGYDTVPSLSPSDGIVEQECFTPELLISPTGAKILDFKQNIAGYIRFKLKGKEGQLITLKMCEALDHGEYSDATLLHVLPDLPSTNQKIEYICKGDGEEAFSPAFFYSGFRYALVEGLEDVDPEDFTAVAVYSNLEMAGEFECSTPMVNRLLENTRWSLKGNFVDIPTDCPQREKSGWTGDAQVFVGTASYLADTAAFYRKWLKDVRDCQREDGRVDNVNPKIRGVDNRDALNGSVGWADAAVIIPYTLWKRYGDPSFITDNYELMHGWEQYVIKAASDKSWYHLPEGHPLKKMIGPWLLGESPYSEYIIESGLHWGEWCEPDTDGGHSELIRPKPEVATAYMHYSMTLLAEMLKEVGKEDEALLCEKYAEGAKKAYNYHYVEDGHIKAPRQAPMVRALALGLLDDETAVKVAAELNESAVKRNYKVGTGFLSTPFVLGVLVKYGYVDTAYKMLENTEAPGWLAMVKQGATTVWEHYTAYDEDMHPLKQSMNHYSPGAVCQFLFDTVCGINVDGENHFCIKPVPGGSLTYAKASYDSVYGKVSCRWTKEDGHLNVYVEIPANTSAKVILPDGRTYEAGYGCHEFVVMA